MINHLEKHRMFLKDLNREICHVTEKTSNSNAIPMKLDSIYSSLSIEKMFQSSSETVARVKTFFCIKR